MSPTRRWQILAALVAVFAISGYWIGRADFVPERRPFESFPREVYGYVGRHTPVSNLALQRLDLTDYLSRDYVRDGNYINVYIGFHGSQSRGSTIHSPQHCLPANGWYIAQRDRVSLPGADPGVLVNRMEVAQGNSRALIYYWYQGRGRRVANEYTAALVRALDAAVKNRSDEALVRFTIEHEGKHSEELLRDFIEAFVPLLPLYLPE
jgi:EpsI family protein